MLEVGVEIVDEQFLLELLLHLGDDSKIEIHAERADLAGLPVLPEPARHVEQESLKRKQGHSAHSESATNYEGRLATLHQCPTITSRLMLVGAGKGLFLFTASNRVTWFIKLSTLSARERYRVLSATLA